MRLSLIALIPLTAFFSVVHARSDYTHEAREHIDELATRAFEDSLLSTRQVLADLSTRDLVNELEDRLQRRSATYNTYHCLACDEKFYTADSANAHGNKANHRRADGWTKNGKDVTFPVT
ncbi:hypothetical protein DFP72DRAFT_1062732 [Ephemerocybe angulata]|uniref:C2H2-type domain-containing protein n=1 Tax=Ephemerocybe angulata TaxID=980116 RepID=A0A8H6I8V8_9AGAR|nr:hypothetical protein DFP72DRAFT_851551 [Tulosesus angulatus]KAF6761021.1 hypothetical protein DFP72DRAFT_1062732 [Tulosesus angulatus]